MKISLLSLIYLISIASAEVLDNIAQLKDDSLEFDESILGRIATHHLSKMSHEDLVNQKFLLDVLQHVNEPIVNKELLQILTSQNEYLIDDVNLYDEGIDDLMAQVVEMSRNKQLLGKKEVFTIAKDEHMRQMVGLYLLFVRSRDWKTLQQNILHARIHVNGVLLVNSLLLAIQDRDDTQNLVMPGIHEILPELYIDEDLIRRAQAIDLSQLETSHAIITETRQPSILDMIRVNKLLHRTSNTVRSLDRRELWMPWREMRLAIKARKMGGINTPMRVSGRDDDRIVLPVTQSSNLAGGQDQPRILTADAGFQSFMHTFINDLCIFDYEITHQNRQGTATGSADLTRVGLERNEGTLLEREIRQKDDQVEGEDTRDIHIDKDNFSHVESRRWSEANGGIDTLSSREQVTDRRRVNINYEDPSNLRWQQREASMNKNVLHKRRMNDDSIWKSNPIGRGPHDRFVGAQLPTTTADDKMNSRDEEKNIGLDKNRGWGKDRDCSRVRSDNNQVNERTHFMGITNRKSIDVHIGDELENNNPIKVNEDNLNMDIGMGMPMDLNKQMAMHRQWVNRVDNNKRVDTLNPTKSSYNTDDLQLHKLPVIDYNNERLLKVGRRKLNQLNWSTKQVRQPWKSEVDERRNPETNTYIRQKDIHNVISNGRQMENPRIWATVARGMGNIGIHVWPQFERQNEVKSEEKPHDVTNNIRLPYIHWGNYEDIGIQDADSDIGVDTWHQRHPRSLTGGSVLKRRGQREQTRGGELILHNLQQLVARINLERISLGLKDDLQLQDNTESSRFNRPRLTNAAEERFALRLNDMRLNTRRNRMLLEKVNEVENRLNEKIEQELIRTIGTKKMKDFREQGSIDRLIGDALMGKEGADQDLNILNVLRGIILQTENVNGGVKKLAHVTVNVGDPIVLHLLQRIVRIADKQRQQQLGGYREEEIKMSGVTINEVKVDKLRTYIGTSDTDLINALDADHILKDLRGVKQSQRLVVARQQRLNHKTFAIKIDVTSDRNQRVVVRILLGPKIGAAGGGIFLNNQRQNFILLDAYIADLHTGRNQIKRKSHDISWTSRDTTPFSEIYKRVMQALNGEVDANLDRIEGQNCRFPHRLLLPRGRVEGLPMQMLVVITQVEDVEHTMQELELDNRVCRMGMGSENLDRLPLGFPLDRPINDEDQIISLPNVQLADVKIYHDNQLKIYDWMNDLYS